MSTDTIPAPRQTFNRAAFDRSVVELRRAGHTLEEIEDTLGILPRYSTHIINRLAPELIQTRASVPPDRAEMAIDMARRGVAKPEIMQTCGYTGRGLKVVLSQAGALRPQGRPPQRTPKEVKKLGDAVVSLRRAGAKYNEIAQKLDIPVNYVSILITRFAPELKHLPRHRLSPAVVASLPPPTEAALSRTVYAATAYGPPWVRDMAVINLRRSGMAYDEICAATAYSQPQVSAILGRWAPDLVTRRPGRVMRAEALRRYHEGQSNLTEIARDLGVNITTITNWIRKANEGHKYRETVDHAEVARLYAGGGHTGRTLAAMFGVSHQRIHQILREQSLTGARRRKAESATREALPAAVEVWREGADVKVLADEIGVPASTLHRAIREVHPSKRVNPARTLDFDALIQMYRTGASEPAIAKAFSITTSHVSGIVRRHAPDAVTYRREARRAAVPPEYRMQGTKLGLFDGEKVVAALRRGEDRAELEAYLGIQHATMSNLLKKHGPEFLTPRGWPKGKKRAP